MKKVFAVLLCLLMLVGMTGCKTPDKPADKKNTIYVLGPRPDHGWTAQAGFYADRTVKEINAKGKYKAVYFAASTGEEQVDHVNTILANGDALAVVFFAQDDGAKAGQEALIDAKIPFISFDRIIEGPDKFAILNASGDNWQCGAGIAYWLVSKGMAPGATLLTLWGDNGTVCKRRQEGFEQFLRGEIKYYDKHLDKTFEIEKAWTKDEVAALIKDYQHVVEPNWSAEGAYKYLEQVLPDVVKKAKANNGKLFIYSMDDEMTFGMMNLIESNALDAAVKADLEALEVYISAIGGMQELYDVIAGTSKQAPVAQKYFEDIMSVFFSPKMMEFVINYMLDYLDNPAAWPYKVGDGKYEPVWIVDKSNVDKYEGFKGHAE